MPQTSATEPQAIEFVYCCAAGADLTRLAYVAPEKVISVMNMNRRTFAALAVLGVVSGVVRKASASTEPPETSEPFRIAQEDYWKVRGGISPATAWSTPRARPPAPSSSIRSSAFSISSSGPEKRYGVEVGRGRVRVVEGTATIRRKADLAAVDAPEEMMERSPEAARWPNGMPGGPENPLGARALYLYQGEVDTLCRIHGTSKPGVGSGGGCLRGAYACSMPTWLSCSKHVEIGTKVIVHGGDQPIMRAAKSHPQPARAALERPLQPARVKEKQPRHRLAPPFPADAVDAGEAHGDA